jgi:hypothetical protein
MLEQGNSNDSGRSVLESDFTNNTRSSCHKWSSEYLEVTATQTLGIARTKLLRVFLLNSEYNYRNLLRQSGGI